MAEPIIVETMLIFKYPFLGSDPKFAQYTQDFPDARSVVQNTIDEIQDMKKLVSVGTLEAFSFIQRIYS